MLTEYVVSESSKVWVEVELNETIIRYLALVIAGLKNNPTESHYLKFLINLLQVSFRVSFLF